LESLHTRTATALVSSFRTLAAITFQLLTKDNTMNNATYTIHTRPNGSRAAFIAFGMPTNLTRQQAFDALEIAANKSDAEFVVVNTAA
jgi:hypothetical protein